MSKKLKLRCVDVQTVKVELINTKTNKRFSKWLNPDETFEVTSDQFTGDLETKLENNIFIIIKSEDIKPVVEKKEIKETPKKDKSSKETKEEENVSIVKEDTVDKKETKTKKRGNRRKKNN